MTINEAKNIMNAELLFGRTPKGRLITDYGKKCIQASLDDIDNYNSPASKCLACGMVVSSLIIENGCVNCGGLDLTLVIEGEIVWKKMIKRILQSLLKACWKKEITEHGLIGFHASSCFPNVDKILLEKDMVDLHLSFLNGNFTDMTGKEF